MRTIIGSILDVESGIIVHQVNCQGVMGAGLAKAIRKKWPRVYQDYKREYTVDRLGLGRIVWSYIPNRNLCVASLCGQDKYGRWEERYTDYGAIEIGLKTIGSTVWALSLPVHIPYKMGCGLGGGDWSIVERIIEEIVPEAIIHKLPDEYP